MSGHQLCRSAQPGQGAGALEGTASRGGLLWRRKAPTEVRGAFAHTVHSCGGTTVARTQETAARTHEHPAARTHERARAIGALSLRRGSQGTTKCAVGGLGSLRRSFQGASDARGRCPPQAFPHHVDYLSVQSKRSEEVPVLVDSPQHVLGLEAKQ